MEGVERRLNADFPLPFFSYESICSRRTRGFRRFSEKAAVTRMEFVVFLKKQPSHAWNSLFFQKK